MRYENEEGTEHPDQELLVNSLFSIISSLFRCSGNFVDLSWYASELPDLDGPKTNQT
jgi:hypothetical protein